MSSVGEEFPKEQERMRLLIDQYREIGNAGLFGLAHITATLKEADEAMASGDPVRIVRAFAAMKDCQ